MPDFYGETLTIWDWEQRKPIQKINLGPEGLLPLELRFLHDPSKAHAYVGAALSSNIIHITKVRQLIPAYSGLQPSQNLKTLQTPAFLKAWSACRNEMLAFYAAL